MENKNSDSCTTQDNGKKGEVSSPLVDRASRARLTRLQAEYIAATQHAEGEARLVTARTNDVYRRFADSSFPPEVRLLVMKAGVLQHASCWRVGHRSTVEDLRQAAFSCLLPAWLWHSQVSPFDLSRLDHESRGILTDTAQQAFLGTTIFKINAVCKQLEILRELRFEVPPLFMNVGVHIRYLEMAICIHLSNIDRPQNYNDAWAAIQDIKWLKFHLPNLKTCVLTLELDCPLLEFDEPDVSAFDRRFLQAPCIPIMRDPSHDFKTLNDGFAKLFEVFADEGPGKSRFVRVRFRLEPHLVALPTGKRQTDDSSFGPLVEAERIGREDTSFGARLVDAAYRLERTDSQLLPEVEQHEWDKLFR